MGAGRWFGLKRPKLSKGRLVGHKKAQNAQRVLLLLFCDFCAFCGYLFFVSEPARVDSGGVCNPKVSGFSPMMAAAKKLGT